VGVCVCVVCGALVRSKLKPELLLL